MSLHTETHKFCSQCHALKTPEDFYAQQSMKRSICSRCYNDNRRDRLYGLVRGEYRTKLHNQGYACAVCGTTKPGGKGNMAVDHHHETGQVRGLLCHSCNIALGHLRDSEELIQNLLDYLKHYNAVRADGWS